MGLRYKPQSEVYEVNVKWQDFDYEEPTWEPFANVQEDVPAILENFLQDYSDQDLVRAATDSGI